jgi:hypothetical protein
MLTASGRSDLSDFRLALKLSFDSTNYYLRRKLS